MSEKYDALCAEISAQQKGKADKPEFFVGEQLKDIARESDFTADLILQDLKNGMTIEKAHAKIKAHADAHKHGNFSIVSPAKADEILREYYGLPKSEEAPAQKKEDTDLIDVADFL